MIFLTSHLTSVYGKLLGWENLNEDEMQEEWKKAKASDMLLICKDIESGQLNNLKMPKHIEEVLEFMKN